MNPRETCAGEGGSHFEDLRGGGRGRAAVGAGGDGAGAEGSGSGAAVEEARSSIPLNIAEWSHAQGARRNLHYGYAKGSAQESIAILETAVASQYIKAVPADVIEMLRKIVG